MTETDRLAIVVYYLIPLWILALLLVVVLASKSGWSLRRIRIAAATSGAAFMLVTGVFVGIVHPAVVLGAALLLGLSGYGYTRLLGQWQESEAGAATRAAAAQVPLLGRLLRRMWRWEQALERERIAKLAAREQELQSRAQQGGPQT